MERRGFIRGVFGGITSAGLLIGGARDEIEAFAAPLVKQAPLVIDIEPLQRSGPIGHGEHLYNSRGELVAVVTAVHLTRAPVEVTSAFDNNRLFIPGVPTFSIEAEGVGGLVVETSAKKLALRGVPRG